MKTLMPVRFRTDDDDLDIEEGTKFPIYDVEEDNSRYAGNELFCDDPKYTVSDIELHKDGYDAILLTNGKFYLCYSIDLEF